MVSRDLKRSAWLGISDRFWVVSLRVLRAFVVPLFYAMNHEATKSALNFRPFLFRALFRVFRVFRVIRGLLYESRTTKHTKHTNKPDNETHETYETNRKDRDFETESTKGI